MAPAFPPKEKNPLNKNNNIVKCRPIMNHISVAFLTRLAWKLLRKACDQFF